MPEYKFSKIFSYTEGSGSSGSGDQDCRTLGCPENEKCTEVGIGITDTGNTGYRCIKECSGKPDPSPNMVYDCKYCEDGKWIWKMKRYCRVPTTSNGDIKWPVGTSPKTHVFDDTFADCPIQIPYQDFPGNDAPIGFGYDLFCPCVPIKKAAYIQEGGKYNTGQPSNWTEGDFNFDGVVDILDVAEAVSQPSPPDDSQIAMSDFMPSVFFVGKDPSSQNSSSCGCTAYDCECEDIGWTTAHDDPLSYYPYRYVDCCPPGSTFDGFFCQFSCGSGNGDDCSPSQVSPSYRNELIYCEGEAPDGCQLSTVDPTYQTFAPDPIVSQTTSSLSLSLDYTITNGKPLILESNI